MLKALLFSALAFLGAQPLFGYVLEGETWTPNRTVAVQLSLGLPRTLSDGFTSFNRSAADVLSIWNTHLAHLTLLPVVASPVVPSETDYEMSAFFSGTIFGDTFGTGTLAVTLISYRNKITSETDTVFNTFYQWDSYDGPLRAGVEDFHRVALHEFGHTLGLDHPDDAGQTVSAIMNSHISDTYKLQPDDIAGVQDLYGSGPATKSSVPAPVLENISTRGLVGIGDNVLIGGFIVQGSQPATVILRAIGFSLTAEGINGALHDPMLTVYDANQNQIATNDDWISGPNADAIASYHLDPPNSIESALLLTLQPGTYTAVMESFSNAQQPAESGIGLFELYDLHTTGGRAGNISTRGQVLGGDGVLIGGFIVGGSSSKPVLVRALGPSLGDEGVANPLSDPFLELHDGNGTLLESNDNWAQGPNASIIQTEHLAPTKAKEAALQATLAPGNYTAIVSGVNGATGVGLVEVYDLSDAPQ
ncbi:MAG: DVUA0089 family protein [Chthoniobacterales bacterium]|nr:DVUA0089 family protein [Chthoniobacterales bacterium]